jgi:RNA polymerase sigma-70 factor (ECF subfamily)
MTSFQELYQQHARDVYRFALYLSRNRAEAEDITSETFIRAWNSRERIRQGTVKSYLLAIARNCFLQGLRHESRYEALDEALADPAPSPDMVAEHRAELARVLQLLQQLPELDRSALLMYSLEGLSYQEIAQSLGLSLAAVKTKIHRARIKLAENRLL